MDGKLNYCKLELCKKPHEKRDIRREIVTSVKVWKMAIFRKTGKTRPREIFLKKPIFYANFRRPKKKRNTSTIIA